MANEVFRDFHGLTARVPSIAADEILLLMERNFVLGCSELEKASPLAQHIVSSYFAAEIPEAYREFNPRLVARIEKLRKKFNGQYPAKDSVIS